MDYGALTAARLRSGQWLHWGIRFFLAAALTATAAYNLAGARAAAEADGPGSVQTAFLEALARLNPEEVAEAPLTFATA